MGDVIRRTTSTPQGPATRGVGHRTPAWRPQHNSNAPFEAEVQSNLSILIALATYVWRTGQLISKPTKACQFRTGYVFEYLLISLDVAHERWQGWFTQVSARKSVIGHLQLCPGGRKFEVGAGGSANSKVSPKP
jgi:hypothetical protein